MTEAVEQLRLLLGIAPHLVVLGQVFDQLQDTRAELVREVRRRRTDDRVDVVSGRNGHGRSVVD